MFERLRRVRSSWLIVKSYRLLEGLSSRIHSFQLQFRHNVATSFDIMSQQQNVQATHK